MVERIGQRFGGYSLVRLLGQGNFADVYLGEDSSRQQLAAIKVLRTELADQDVKQFHVPGRGLCCRGLRLAVG